jgi:hypothetical protein
MMFAFLLSHLGLGCAAIVLGVLALSNFLLGNLVGNMIRNWRASRIAMQAPPDIMEPKDRFVRDIRVGETVRSSISSMYVDPKGRVWLRENAPLESSDGPLRPSQIEVQRRPDGWLVRIPEGQQLSVRKLYWILKPDLPVSRLERFAIEPLFHKRRESA